MSRTLQVWLPHKPLEFVADGVWSGVGPTANITSENIAAKMLLITYTHALVVSIHTVPFC